MRLSRFIIAPVVFASLTGCMAPADETTTMPAGEMVAAADVMAETQAIEETNAQWLAAVANGDAAGAASFYTSDGRLMMPNAPTAQGAAEVEAAFTQILAAPNIALSWAQTQVEVASSGDVAWDVGTYTLAYDGPDGRVEDNGKYIVVWKKTETGWRVAGDIFNSNLPAQ